MQLPPFRLERFFARHEFTAPHLLCCSDGESVSVGELLDLVPGAADGLSRVHLGYTESKGAPALRQAVAGLYETTAPDDVLVHVGAEEAIFTFMAATLAPGDAVVVVDPRYQSLADVARSLGARPLPWRLDPARGFAPDLGELQALLAEPAVKALVLNFPHNPTGYMPAPEDFAAMLAAAAARGVRVFSDEVYRRSESEGVAPLPAACDLDPRAVSLGVLSKSYGLAGLRVGWAACRDRKLLARMASVKDYLSICGSAPSEYLATCALAAGGKLLSRMAGILEPNRRFLADCFTSRADLFDFTPPRGGLTAFPALRQGSADAFCQALLEATGVLLLPGSLYGQSWSQHFRIGFGRVDFRENCERLAGFCQKWNPGQGS